MNIKINPKIVEMMVQVKLIHWVVVLAATAFLGLAVIVIPIRVQYSKAQKNVRDIKIRLANLEKAMSGVGDFDLVLTKHRLELADLKAKTLQVGDQSKVISLLTQTTEELGISILNIKPLANAPAAPSEKSSEGSKLKSSLFEIEMESRYTALGVFFESLEKAPVMLTLEKLETQPGEGNAAFLRTHVTLASYEE